MTNTEVKQKEHRLAEKAKNILEHQHELQSIEDQKATLLKQKPAADKERLSYLESVEFGRKIKEYKNELREIDFKIQKITRELNALKKQAKKLLPASGIKIKVSTHPNDDTPVQVFCIRYIKSENAAKAGDQFEIKPLNK